MATKYEKLEAEYNLLTTHEQQWAWVLAHKDDIEIFLGEFETEMSFKKDLVSGRIELPFIGNSYGILPLLSVLGIEVEEV